MAQTKKCSCCGFVKSVDEFYFNKTRQDGLQHYCKICKEKLRGRNKQILSTEYLPKEKRCSVCDKIKQQIDFHLNTGKKDGLSCQCIECYKKRRTYNKQHKKSYHRLNKYGLNDFQYSQLLEKQNNVCAICGKTVKLCVDHNHKTNKVRGLLCSSCNKMLGFAKDNPQILRDGADYVEDNIK